MPAAVLRLGYEFEELEDEYDSPQLQLREYRIIDGEVLKRTIAAQLRAGTTGRIDPINPPNYEGLADSIYRNAEIPLRLSPLKGVTLSSLLGATGSAGMLQLFHSGVTPTEAALSVLFVAGTMIVFGAADVVRRAVEAG
jgi:hypothetical protein